MSSESLLPKTCYICLEECSTTSPCECQVPVHRKCLYEFNTKSKNTKCTICQSEFKTHWVFKCMVLVYTAICSILLGVVFYISCGFAGEFVGSVLGICDCEARTDTFVNTITTMTFVTSSFVLMLLLVLMRLLYKKIFIEPII